MALSLEKQQKILELAAQGKKPAEIAKDLGHQEATVNKLLAKVAAESLANNGTAVAKRNKGELIVHPIKDSEGLIKSMTTEPQQGFAMGQGAGLTIGIAGEQLIRLVGGRGSDEESDSLFGTALGVLAGIYQGTKTYHKVYPEEREERRKNPPAIDVAEIVRVTLETQEAQDLRIAKIAKEVVNQMREEEKKREGES